MFHRRKTIWSACFFAGRNQHPRTRSRRTPKDQVSADSLRGQLKDLSQKIRISIQPVFVSHKIEQDLKLREVKPQATVYQQCLVTCAMQVLLVSNAGTYSLTCWRAQELVFIYRQTFPR